MPLGQRPARPGEDEPKAVTGPPEQLPAAAESRAPVRGGFLPATSTPGRRGGSAGVRGRSGAGAGRVERAGWAARSAVGAAPSPGPSGSGARALRGENRTSGAVTAADHGTVPRRVSEGPGYGSDVFLEVRIALLRSLVLQFSGI